MPIPVETLLANVDAMRRLAHAVVHDPDRADDVTQTAILTALRRPPRSHRNLRGWLFGVVRNAARDDRRKERRHVARDRQAARPEAAPARPSIPAQVHTQKRLLNAVLALPEAYRDVVWLRYFEGLPPRKVADRLSIPVETVRTRHRRAVARLRGQLDDEHEGQRARWMAALLPVAAAQPARVVAWGGLMASKVKTASAAAVVILALLAGWWLWRSEDTSHDEGTTAVGGTDPVQAPTLQGAKGSDDDATEAVADVPEHDGPFVTGVARDERGAPLEGVTIRMGPLAQRDLARLSPVARTDADGAFHVPWPDDLQDARFVATAPRRRLDAAQVWGPPQKALSFRLPRARDLVLVVRDGDTDAPIPGATVTSHTMAGLVEVVSTARANTQGRVTLPSPSAHAMDYKAPLRIEAPGYTPVESIEWRTLEGDAATAARPRDVYLFPGTGLRIRVVDEAGKAVAGALVKAWRGGGSTLMLDPRTQVQALGAKAAPAGGQLLGEATSDTEGRVTLSALAQGEVWHARAQHGALVGVGYGYARPDKAQDGLVTIRPSADLSVEVVDEEGDPVAGAQVESWPELWNRALRSGGFRLAPHALQRMYAAITDTEGRATLKAIQLPSAPKKVSVMARRGDAGFGWAKLPTTFAPDTRIRIVLKSIGDATSLHVRVVDVHGDPIPEALVSHGNMSPGTLTDPEGKARLSGMPRVPGKPGLGIQVSKAGYAVARVPSSDGPIEVVLHAESVATGRVVNPDDSGCVAYVDFYRGELADVSEAERKKRAQLFRPDWLGRAETDAQGYFHRDGLPPGPWWVDVWTPRRGVHEPIRRVRQRIEDTGEALTIRLPEPQTPKAPRGALVGNVRSVAGEALSRYSIMLVLEKRHIQPVLKGKRFRFEDVPAGAYTLRATSVDRKQRIEMTVDVIAGRDTDVQVTLGESATLRVRILAPDGTPARGVPVRALRPGRRTWGSHGRTDSDGWFELEHRMPDVYHLTLVARDDMPAMQLEDAKVDLRPGAPPPPVFRAKKAARVILALDDERFKALEERNENLYDDKGVRSYGTRLHLLGPGDEQRDFWGLFHGRWTTEWALFPGRYHLTVKTGDAGTFDADFVVGEVAADVVIDVRLVESAK